MTSNRPILVTGSHRSGTTWVGRMLCASGEAGYIHEPFNPNRSPGWFTDPLPYWFMHIAQENESAYREPVADILRLRYPIRKSVLASARPRQLAAQMPEIGRSLVSRARGRRPLLKDPLALFSAEWLAENFGAHVVMMIRHPASFISSIKRLDWGFDYEQQWLGQPLLMEHLLGHRRDEYRGYEGEVDLVGEGIVVWNSIHDVIRGYQERHPDWCFVRYEDLAGAPVAGFDSLYRNLDLQWSHRVARKIVEFARETNPKEVSPRRRREIKRDSKAARRAWVDRLTPEEIQRIHEGTKAVAAHFYADTEWEGQTAPLDPEEGPAGEGTRDGPS